VWVATDRVIVRWLSYLDRIAAIYARGRFTVRPRRISQSPPEIRELGEAMSAMAEAIVARDKILRENLAHKDALMREIHHRVKNNLQVISSLLNMQQRAMTDSVARAAMSDTRQRISAIALIYRTLYQGPDLRTVDLRPFLEELTAQLLSGEGHRAGVRTELEADELVVDPDKLAPLALFAVEAISNAQKHAFGPAGGLLKVRFAVEGEEAILEISDAGADVEPTLVTEGVGRTLMTAFARQLRGRAEVFANGAGGVTARLIFPTPEAERILPPDADNADDGAKGNPAAA
jgi:two-component sensor histidine kinase